MMDPQLDRLLKLAPSTATSFDRLRYSLENVTISMSLANTALRDFAECAKQKSKAKPSCIPSPEVRSILRKKRKQKR